MTIRLRSAILVLEAAVFALPVTVLWALGVLLIVDAFQEPDAIDVLFALAMVLAGISLVALWWMIFVDVRWGRSKLFALNSAWFFVAGIGAVWSLLAVVAVVFLKFDVRQSLPLELLCFGIYGIPAVVPYLHVMFDRWRSNGGIMERRAP